MTNPPGTIAFDGTVLKGNSDFVGFVKLPTCAGRMHIGDWIEITPILNGAAEYPFYRVVRDYGGCPGFYTPKSRIPPSFLGKHVTFRIRKIGGFYAKVNREGRLHIPLAVANRFALIPDSIVIMQAYFNDETFVVTSKVKYRSRRHEFHCAVPSELGGRCGIFRMMKKLHHCRTNDTVKSFLRNRCFGALGKKKIIVIQHKSMLVLPSSIYIDERFAFYLGSYFADGTKKGAWHVTASTFEQGIFYRSMHEHLVLNPEYYAYVSMTSSKPVDPHYIGTQWATRVGIAVNTVRIRKVEKISNKVNPHGSLVVGDNRKVVLDMYLSLLRDVIDYIRRSRDKRLASAFICGVLEGDGSASARKRGHVIISTNIADVGTLSQLLEIAGLQFAVVTEFGNGRAIRIGALSILENFLSLERRLFVLYPKRRRVFVERFYGVGAVKFLLGSQKKCPAWVQSRLKRGGILGADGVLTPKGTATRRKLKSMYVPTPA